MSSERIFKFFFALLILLISILGIGLALGWTTPLIYLENYLRGTNERWVLGILGVIGFLVSIFILKNSFKEKMPNQAEVIVTTLGQIKITINALESMANKVARQISGVKETNAIIKCIPNGIAVFMQINLAPEIHIPEVTTQIQNEVKEYFSKVVGIEVEEVRILVTKSGSEAKNKAEKSRVQ